jgi:hypothetical protein
MTTEVSRRPRLAGLVIDEVVAQDGVRFSSQDGVIRSRQASEEVLDLGGWHECAPADRPELGHRGAITRHDESLTAFNRVHDASG